MRDVISICIPTCNRPALLKDAIESCLDQDYRPIELLIGDNSRDNATAHYVEKLTPPEGVVLRYLRNTPPLGQSGNVNRLFDCASGSRLLIMHDDDLLCRGGLDLLVRMWRDSPGVRCVYGKQQVVDPHGAVLPAETEALNEMYFRVTAHEGRQASCVEAALRQQMPNNGFLIDSALARTVRYRPEAVVGQSVDADFAIRVGAEAGDGAFLYVGQFVSQYRLSADSIMRSRSINHGQDLFFLTIEQLRLADGLELAQRIMLDRLGAEASLDAALAGRRMLALRILLSQHYGRPMMSRWTAFRLLCIIWPQFGMALGKRLRRR